MPDVLFVAATALQVACIVSSGSVQSASCSLSELLVGAGAYAYSRPAPELNPWPV